MRSFYDPMQPGAHQTPEPPSVALDPIQSKIMSEVLPRSFFITGPAGTGKSVLATEMIARLRKSGRRVFVTASTGIAAIHVAGCTIHSWLGTNIVGSVAEAKTKSAWDFNEKAEYRIRSCHVLVVDEISMLTGDYVDLIDWRLREVCHSELPFAGKQVLFFGDFCQLPPVIRDKRGVNREFAFQAEAWERAGVLTRELTVNHRQGEDAAFSAHLSKIRVGDYGDDTAKFLKACVGRRLRKAIMLYPTNVAVDGRNRDKLAQIPGDARLFNAEMSGDKRACEMLARNCIADQTLRVKVGAQVLMIKNVYQSDGVADFVNGERGIVTAIRDDGIDVYLETEDRERDITASKTAWEWRDADNNVLASLVQFPIKLGWAVTIHKCVAPDTLIETNNGLERVSDVSSAGSVATWDGRASYDKKVCNPLRPALRITTTRGYELTMTPEHKIMIRGCGGWVLREARYLGPGHELRLRRGHPTRGWMGSPDGHQKISWWRCPVDLHSKPFQLPSIMSSELAEFLGLMVADGTVHRAGFRLAKRHKEVSDRFAELGMKIFGLHPHYSMLNGAHVTEFNSMPVAYSLHLLGGLSPHQKAIPVCILKASLREQRAFLRGLFEDGGVSMKRGHFSGMGWRGVSVVMACDIQIMLLRLGMVATRYKASSSWRVDLYGQDAARFRDTIGFISNMKQERLKGAGSRHKQRGKRFTSEIVDQIDAINETTSASMCLEVPGHHRFLQNGFDGSNSQGMTLERMRCDISRCFAPGQAYVALSRAKNAKHLSLDGVFNKAQVFADPTCVKFYRKACSKVRMVKAGKKK